jgi:hypothetical protein
MYSLIKLESLRDNSIKSKYPGTGPQAFRLRLRYIWEEGFCFFYGSSTVVGLIDLFECSSFGNT